MENKATTLHPFHVLAKPVGPACNLACRYCFYLEKERLYPGKPHLSDWILPDEILEEYIRQYLASQSVPVVSFAWQGGEPTLLGVDYFRKVLALQEKYANGKRIENTLQTNGILLDDGWCEFLAANRFLIGLSLDGPRHLHDRYRVDKGGAPSFDRVMRSVGFLKKHGVDFNTLTVVQKLNSRYPLEVYRFLREIGHGFMQFIPIVERVALEPAADGLQLVSPKSAAAAKVTEWSVEPLQYGRFLCSILDEWVRNDVGKIFVQLFDVTLAAWMGMEPSLCVFQRTCGSAVVLEHNGDIYSCDHYVYPENRLGNIMEQPLASMLNSPQQTRFGQDKKDRLPRFCLDCNVRFICNGECPKHRFAITPDGEENLNYLCPGYKLFFTHSAPYMKFMASELRAQRPPANVMEWARKQDSGSAGGERPGRNDPCPCGSGKKYKKCCGKT
ncbi:MAG: anaerobic sulfatase-maturation protein [Acidobacteria bacterium]|nr:anaerobic sulfatase-maturation protein [Acidobacteriota bacterium]